MKRCKPLKVRHAVAASATAAVREEFDSLLELAGAGIVTVIEAQNAAIAKAGC